MTKISPLTQENTIEEWLADPDGGLVLREKLKEEGQSPTALDPMAAMPLKSLVTMSEGRVTQDDIDEVVKAVNGGEIPKAPVAPAQNGAGTAGQASDWKERIVPGRFDGKTVIVTGAGSGIGKATALRLMREGARVIATDIAAGRLDDLANEAGIGNGGVGRSAVGAPGATDAVADVAGAGKATITGPTLVTVPGDISKQSDVDAVIAAADGQIDGVANVAGIMDDMTAVHEVSDETWDRVFAVNVDGPMRLMRAALPLMLEAGKGSIVNVASEASLRGSAAGVAYTTSKHALVGLTKSASFMYQKTGIRVNAVAPGPVKTGIQASFSGDFSKERVMSAMAILPAMATSEQLAASITFMLSDDAVNITGAILPSDGGWSAV
jgi:NAD(P)-dependent dehydrogenase (short-subunit alcohol dehydrogenase family)